MLSQTVVLEGESQTRFEDLLADFTTQLKPRSAAEAAILETMAIARWKQMRIWGVQKAGFDLEMTQLNSSCNIPATRAYMVFKKLADNSRVLDLQHRYETGYDRQFCRAYAFFLKLREKPETQLEDADFSQMSFSFATATWEPASEHIQEQTQEETPVPPQVEVEVEAENDEQENKQENQNGQPNKIASDPPRIPSKPTQTADLSSPKPVLRNEPDFSKQPIPKQPASSRRKR
jgi:hypothetical protein